MLIAMTASQVALEYHVDTFAPHQLEAQLRVLAHPGSESFCLVADGWALHAVLERHDSISIPLRHAVLVRTELRQADSHHLAEIARRIPQTRFAVASFASLADEISMLKSERPSTSPVLQISCADLFGGLPPFVLLAAAILTTRRISVEQLARACGCSRRTLECRVKREGLVGPRQIVAWSTVLHALWRVERQGWNLKRAAHAAGFDAELFTAYVKRHLGQPPSQVLRNGGFDRALTRWAALVAGKTHDDRFPPAWTLQCAVSSSPSLA